MRPTSRPRGKTQQRARIAGWTELHHPTKALLSYLSTRPTLLTALEHIAAGRVTYKLALKWVPERKASRPAKKRRAVGK